MDLSPTLIGLARDRLRDLESNLDVTFLVGDMRDMDLGSFDYAVAMDSLIHYDVTDGVQTLESMAEQINRKMVFTFAPKTPLLALMHATGRLFPRSDRAPSIEPVSPRKLSDHLEQAGLMTHGRRGVRIVLMWDFISHTQWSSRDDDTRSRQYGAKLAGFGHRWLPFADAASEDLSLGRLLRLSMFQISTGMAIVLLTGTLNRVMVVG